MKTNLLLIFVLISTLISASFSTAQAEINAFKQGTVWTEIHESMYDPDYTIYTFTIDGECELNGRNCMQLWKEVSSSSGYEDPKIICTYLFTEGDKVYFVPTYNTDTCFLMYDFGIEVGESVEVVDCWDNISYRADKYSKWTNQEISNITSCGNTFRRIEIKTADGEPDNVYGSGYWIKGIGEAISVVANISYIDVVGLGRITNIVTVDGEEVFRSDSIGPCAIESVTAEDSAVRFNLNGMRVSSSDKTGFRIENRRVVVR